MIPVTYEPMEGVAVDVQDLCRSIVNKYTWQDNSVPKDQSGVSNASQYCNILKLIENDKRKDHTRRQNEHM
jgi:hypothetical protein